MADAWLVGTHSTAFRKWPERGFRDLVREAVAGALDDAGLPPAGAPVGQVWFGSCALGVWGQDNIRGQTLCSPLQRSGVLPPRVPIGNVEGGCATGSLALLAALRDVWSGQVELSLAIGVDKVLVPGDPARTLGLFSGGIDQRHPDEWRTHFDAGAAEAGLDFTPEPGRVLFLDVHALQARHHMQVHHSTVEQLATIASKSHFHGSMNPLAQYRFEVSPEQALADRMVVEPLTRSMCCPISDGAAAVLVCSDAGLQALPAAARERAIKVRSCALVGGSWRSLSEPNVLAHAAAEAYGRAGVGPNDIDVAEVHDATAFCELQATELLGFCPVGRGGAWAQSGASRLGGALPVNLSGGLLSKGHPLAATGLSMIDELVTQLRGEAGPRQAADAPALGLAHNAGGQVGFDEALCAVTILERV